MNFLKSSWESVVWAFVVLTLSVIDTGGADSGLFSKIPHFDKFVHFILYLVFSYLVIYDLKKSGSAGDSSMPVYIMAALTASVFGGCMELIQLIPGLHRSADIADFVANITGSVTAPFFFNPVNRFVQGIRNG